MTPVTTAVADIAAWTDFAEGVAAVSAGLTGLLGVAVSINLAAIVADARLPGRALATLTLLATPLFVALVLLVPDQSPAAVGVELLAVAVLTSPLLGSLVRPSRRSAEQPVAGWVVGSVVPVVVLVAGLAVAGAGLLAGEPATLYAVAAAVVAAFVGGLGNVWVLLVEILR